LTVDGGMAVHTGRAELWEPPMRPTRLSASQTHACLVCSAQLALHLRGRSGLAGLLGHLDRLLSAAPGRPPETLDVLAAAAWPGVALLLRAWRSNRPARAARAAARLVGLGPGLTPSGDDLLAGFMVAGLGDLSAGARERNQAVLEAAVGRTSDLGFARLRYAAEGELDGRSVRTLDALVAGRPFDVEAATTDLLAYGHSSGVDTLVGLLLGVGLRLQNYRLMRSD
jgi:hypothetical protein